MTTYNIEKTDGTNEIISNVSDIYQKFVGDVEYPTLVVELENSEKIEFDYSDIKFTWVRDICPECEGMGECGEGLTCKNCDGDGYIDHD